MSGLTLTKHHGLGNDFLILLDLDGRHPVDEALARALCDRHRGVGADGVIRVTAGGPDADVTMELRNADGSPAEISGNGIRCLAQAVLDAGVVTGDRVRVATAAGLKLVTVRRTDDPNVVDATVDLGPAKVEPWAGEAPDRAALVDLGNPHLVILDQARQLDLAAVGGAHPELNVELIAVSGGGIELRVWERGSGPTLACGSGAAAAVAAARQWGIVDERVVVEMPGGTVEVSVGDTVTLTGPSEYVAKVDVP